MKKKIFALAVIVICLSLLVSSTIAYFNDMGKSRNVIVSGGVDIELLEQTLVDGVLQPYPDEPVPVMPGTTVSKIVSVKNVAETAWIRVRYSATIHDATGKKMALSHDDLAELVTIAPDANYWTYWEGWWYYNDPVDTGKTTEPLFKSVSFSGPNMGNEFQNASLYIDITAQAVQYANNGISAPYAGGWPES